MQTNRLYLALSLGLLLFSACDSEQSDPNFNRLGYQYFPLEVGDYRVYDVVEINFTLVEGGDTNNFQLKEVIEDYHELNEEDTSFYLYRYSRSTDQEEWELDSVWTARKDPRRVVVTENNVPVIKLVFPVSAGTSWDGNAMNAEQEETYSISVLDEPFEVDGEQFSETLRVVEKDNMDTVITERYREAIYAEGIGLVYKEQRYLDYCATNVECLGEGIIEGGRKYTLTLKEYGKE